jgi:phosphoribosylformylglycinamidine synthase
MRWEDIGILSIFEWNSRRSVHQLDLHTDSINSNLILKVIKNGLISCAHDCSKGGLSIALLEMAIGGSCGIEINLDKVPNNCKRLDNFLFSETPSRFIIGTKNEDKIEKILSSCKNLEYSKIGKVVTSSDRIIFHQNNKKIIDIEVEIAKKYYENISKIMESY